MSRVVFERGRPADPNATADGPRSTTHEVHVAHEGRRCLDVIDGVRPDVVFSDVAMPEMDGVELADAMRARPELAHLPIIFMTVSGQRQRIEECFRHGTAGHLPKSFTMAELRARVGQFSKS